MQYLVRSRTIACISLVSAFLAGPAIAQSHQQASRLNEKCKSEESDYIAQLRPYIVNRKPISGSLISAMVITTGETDCKLVAAWNYCARYGNKDCVAIAKFFRKHRKRMQKR